MLSLDVKAIALLNCTMVSFKARESLKYPLQLKH